MQPGIWWFKGPSGEAFPFECRPRGIHIPSLAANVQLKDRPLKLNGVVVDFNQQTGYKSLEEAADFIGELGRSAHNPIPVSGQPAGELPQPFVIGAALASPAALGSSSVGGQQWGKTSGFAQHVTLDQRAPLPLSSLLTAMVPTACVGLLAPLVVQHVRSGPVCSTATQAIQLCAQQQRIESLYGFQHNTMDMQRSKGNGSGDSGGGPLLFPTGSSLHSVGFVHMCCVQWGALPVVAACGSCVWQLT